mmetsp:Transcript_53385/g.98714  ORF Transcript_53385/g.98714 Transcript_53385/m.98714 type:complete len:105 (+) Transcript_53385:107-421(+)
MGHKVLHDLAFPNVQVALVHVEAVAEELLGPPALEGPQDAAQQQQQVQQQAAGPCPTCLQRQPVAAAGRLAATLAVQQAAQQASLVCHPKFQLERSNKAVLQHI